MYATFSVCYNTEYFMITYVEVITQDFLNFAYIILL